MAKRKTDAAAAELGEGVRVFRHTRTGALRRTKGADLGYPYQEVDAEEVGALYTEATAAAEDQAGGAKGPESDG